MPRPHKSLTLSIDENEKEERIFEEALNATSEIARQAILDEHCGDDLALRERIEALLRGYKFGSSLESNSYLEEFSAILGGLEGKQLGNYRVIELIGEGGMGEVYLAKSLVEPYEAVAIKSIKPGMDTRQVISRFEQERRNLKSLEHPNIARYLDFGVVDNGRAYFVMELVRGLPITEHCQRYNLPLRERLLLFVEACVAIHHANSLGLVHRDIKPNNILVAKIENRSAVKIIDFGVAKALAPEVQPNSVFTGIRQWLGTPAYMSPEQALWSQDVDARSDVYSLGSVLYELLAGCTPLAAHFASIKDLDGIRRAIVELTPLKPSRQLNSSQTKLQPSSQAQQAAKPVTLQPPSSISRDLDLITLKAVEKKREDRYQSVEELANDVVAFMDGRAITATRSRMRDLSGYLAIRKSKMQGRSSPFSMVLILCVLLLTYLSWSFVKSSAEPTQNREISANSTAPLESTTEPTLAYVSTVKNIVQLHSIGDREEAINQLRICRESDHEWKNSFLIRYLESLVTPSSDFTTGHHTLSDMDLTNDGSRLVTCDHGGEVKLWDRKHQLLLHSWKVNDREVHRVRFSPDGKHVATCGQDYCVRVWSCEDYSLVHEFVAHNRTINGLTWSPSGTQIASGDRDGIVCIWDSVRGVLQEKLRPLREPVRVLQWSPDGKWLAAAEGDLGTQIWKSSDWSTWLYITNLNVKAGARAISFSPEGRWMAAGGYRGELVVLDFRSKTVSQVETGRTILSVYFKSEEEIYVGLEDGRLLKLRPLAGGIWQVFRTQMISPSNPICRVVQDPSTNHLGIALTQSGEIRWTPEATICGYETLNANHKPIGNNLELGSRFETDSQEPFLQITNDGEPPRRINTPRIVEPVAPAYSAKSNLLGFVGSNAGEPILYACNPQSKQVEVECFASGTISNVSVGCSGTRFVVSGSMSQPMIWDPSANSLLKLGTSSSQNGEYLCASSPTCDDVLIAIRGEKNIERFSGLSGEKLAAFAVDHPVYCLQYSRSGDMIAIGGEDRVSGFSSKWFTELWSSQLVTNFSPSASLPRVRCLCFTPDDKMITAYCNSTLHFLDAATQFEVLSLPIHMHEKERSWWMGFENENRLAIGHGDSKSSLILEANPQ